MLEISIETKGVPENIAALLEQVSESALRTEGVAQGAAFLRIVDDETIHAINREMRSVDRPTDVLSFPTVSYPAGKTAKDCPKRLKREFDAELGAPFLGDFVISLETAQRQAHEYAHSLEREMGYLTAHAMLHLMGYDHETDGERAEMRTLEEQIMNNVQLPNENEIFDTLFDRASEVLKNAYAPYSNYRVGACLLAEDGTMFDGCNFENSSYGATICAERCAVGSAVAAGKTRFTAIAVVGEFDDAWPCGMCRQVLSEFAVGDMPVICGTAHKTYRVLPLSKLLPSSFSLRKLLEENAENE